VKINKI